MTEYPDLETEIQELWGEANGMVLANRLDSKRAGVLQRRLRDCADRAHDAGYVDRERLLRRAAADLAERFPSPPE
jgi:hypothetical protein